MLKSPDVHTENILKLASFIEELEYIDVNLLTESRLEPPKIWDFKFNMCHIVSNISGECGTAGCICGAGMAMFQTGIQGVEKHLGLEWDVAHELFFPASFKLPGGSYNGVTPKQAAKVLRHLAVTGEVDWSIIHPERN